MSEHIEGRPETWDGAAAAYEDMRLRAARQAEIDARAGLKARAAWWQEKAERWRRIRDQLQRLADERSKR